MAKLTIPNRFLDGATMSGAGVAIDANFDAVATLLNTTKLGRDNFRAETGIVNDKKQKPFSNVLVPVAFPSIWCLDDKTLTLSGVWSYPYYNAGLVDSNTAAARPFKVVGFNGVYNSHSNLQEAGDSVVATLVGRRRNKTENETLATLTLKAVGDVPAPNLLVTTAVSGLNDIVYAELHLTLTCPAVTPDPEDPPGPGPLRKINNLVVNMLLSFEHI